MGLISSGIFFSELLMDLVLASSDVTSEAYLCLMIRTFQSAFHLRMKEIEVAIASKIIMALEIKARRVDLVSEPFVIFE